MIHQGLEVCLFEQYQGWLDWLDQNHTQTESIWLQFAKKASSKRSLSYEEAREGALRYGWIDGLKNRLDDDYHLIKFSPRRPRSRWSKINRELCEQLLAEGKMFPSGRAQVEAAQADGRWEAAYPSQATIEVPDDLKAALTANPKALETFQRLTSSQRFSILYRLHDARRPETRQRRLDQFLALLLEGKPPR
ncbi:MAG: YdeI family protein [Vulcanimicrobiota bacterium]